jgi:hypothetical protein
MSQIDLVYVHLPCPKCGEHFVPLKAWIIPSDFDEDGHSNGIEVETLQCAKCGELDEIAKAICDTVIEAMYHVHDLSDQPALYEVGTIYSLYSSPNEGKVPDV